MCNFLAALVLPDGSIVCKPEATDSHEVLVAYSRLRDDGSGAFVRVEFLAGGNVANAASYTLRVDQPDTPDWFTDAMRTTVAETLRDRMRRMIVLDDRAVLLGGCWILAGDAQVGVVHNARIIAMLGTSRVGKMLGTSRVGKLLGSSRVGTMWHSSQVGKMQGTSRVGKMQGTSQVGEMLDSSQVVLDCSKGKEVKRC